MKKADKVKRLMEISGDCDSAISKAKEVIAQYAKLRPKQAQAQAENKGVNYLMQKILELQGKIDDIDAFISGALKADVESVERQLQIYDVRDLLNTIARNIGVDENRIAEFTSRIATADNVSDENERAEIKKEIINAIMDVFKKAEQGGGYKKKKAKRTKRKNNKRTKRTKRTKRKNNKRTKRTKRTKKRTKRKNNKRNNK